MLDDDFMSLMNLWCFTMGDLKSFKCMVSLKDFVCFIWVGVIANDHRFLVRVVGWLMANVGKYAIH